MFTYVRNYMDALQVLNAMVWFKKIATFSYQQNRPGCPDAI
jgi:hypothetical protein